MSLFKTLDERRQEELTAKDRFLVWFLSVGGAIAVVTAVVVVMLYM